MPVESTPPEDRSKQPGVIARGAFALASWYARKMPINQGKGILQRTALRLLNQPAYMVQTDHGFAFELHFPEHHGWEDVVFRKSFETGTTELVGRLLREDDVSLDIGANLGWFTVVLARHSPRGLCHAFEPSPGNFRQLQANCTLNQTAGRVRFNLTALGDHQGKVKLFSFSDLGCGRSSLSTLGQAAYTEALTPMTTLDAYFDAASVNKVDLVKMDVEGAECKVLDGAVRLLALEPQPIWLLEMNQETAASFDYLPADLLRRVTERGRWRLIRIPDGWGNPQPMKRLTDFRSGDNVICIPLDRKGWFETLPETVN